MQFKIREDINIRAWSWDLQNIKDFQATDISQSVSYFVEKINKIPETEKRIGVVFGMLSFHALCCMLALVKTGRDYVIFYDTKPSDDSHLALSDCSHVFFLRKAEEDVTLLAANLQGTTYDIVCTADFEQDIHCHSGHAPLYFEFSKTQRTYIAMFMSLPEIAYTTGDIEASSIQAAMDHYYLEDDICVFVRPFKHVGVATLAIYPAVFKTKDITLCENRDDWDQQHARATNIHVAFDMIREQWPMPKHLRMLTTGGYHFNSQCIDYVTSNSTVENIVDCYGTAFCPPPLAIRHLSKENPSPAFQWVNDFVKMQNVGDALYLKSSEPDTFQGLHSEVDGMLYTGDKISTVDSEHFMFLGSARRYVRTRHTRIEDFTFVKLFKSNTGVSECAIEFRVIDNVEIPFLKVHQKDLQVTEQFILDNSAEITVELLN
jgi:hypothetical protein